ncbi:MAG: hypothetical protein ABEJ68_03050 [Halobacteriaceae archaeon]
MAEDATVPLRWVLLFAVVTLGALALAVLYVGGDLITPAGLLALPF